ncbi:GNAT family N-acetyltransferase [Amycolatopsis coloradensis]|uniref:GNAT family N-acetyltransferase n=1 Tax=Amycolatopsis coloradensis TaxID=76021 RepID=A0A1R0L2H1_9PSEU|nr:GNAT family N-acetyltransferase [Amycolatopsis coloradensis]OLZ56555.1 GNAT family N-acetyltransferase [Amycolatopsis coloradensis]
MANDVTLRPAVAQDASAVAEIWYHGWQDGHLGNVPDALLRIRTRESFRERASARVGDTSVALVAGEVAGFVMVVGDEVEQVYVSSTHRGSGVAGVLLAEAERLVGDGGHSRAWLAVAPGNARARRFYERCGWVDEGEFENRVEGPDGLVLVPCRRYVRTLV